MELQIVAAGTGAVRFPTPGAPGGVPRPWERSHHAGEGQPWYAGQANAAATGRTHQSGDPVPLQAQTKSPPPVAETDGLAQQQPGGHRVQPHRVALVAGGAVLTQEADPLPMEPGMEIQQGLLWCGNPRLTRLPAHPMR